MWICLFWYIMQAMTVDSRIRSIEKQHGDADIKALDMQGYQSPETIVIKGKNQNGFTPDVMFRNDDRTELFEVELNEEVELGKLRLFSLFSKKEKGQLHIVTPKKNLSRFRTLLNSNKISAKLIYL